MSRGSAPGYETPAPFLSRVGIYAWQENRVDLPGVAAAALRDVRGVVVDVGCGPGIYARRLAADRPDLRVATTDLSPGMRPLVVADAQRLPYADDSAGGALAMHMLYHVPDIPAAIAELRRVLRPGGVLLVSTNARADKPELEELAAAATAALAGGGRGFRSPASAFPAEDAGGLLGAAFDDVVAERFERRVVVPEAAPVLAYLDSLRSWYERDLPPGVSWAGWLAAAGELLGHDGFAFTSRMAVFTCR
jgi:SAM-dependent methyltransferase